MLHRSAKTLLQNVIRHTGSHNRMVEEADMWRQKEKKSSQSSKKDKDKEKGKDKDKDKDQDQDKDQEKKNSDVFFFDDTRKSFLYDNRVRDDSAPYRRYRRAHMDEEPVPSSSTRSTYWTRQLQRAEENDPGRWGHSGYKELYPEEFRSDRSEDEENGHHHRHKRSMRKRRKEKRKRHRYRSKSDDSQSDSEPRRKRRKSTGCSKHRKHRRSRDSSSGSETVRYIRRKMRKDRHHRRHKTERPYESDVDIKPRLGPGGVVLPPQSVAIRTTPPPMVHHRRSRRVADARDCTSLRDHRQTRHMSSDNTDSEAENDGPKRQKFKRDYSSSDSEDSYCAS